MSIDRHPSHEQHDLFRRFLKILGTIRETQRILGKRTSGSECEHLVRHFPCRTSSSGCRGFLLIPLKHSFQAPLESPCACVLVSKKLGPLWERKLLTMPLLTQDEVFALPRRKFKAWSKCETDNACLHNAIEFLAKFRLLSLLHESPGLDVPQDYLEGLSAERKRSFELFRDLRCYQEMFVSDFLIFLDWDQVRGTYFREGGEKPREALVAALSAKKLIVLSLGKRWFDARLGQKADPNRDAQAFEMFIDDLSRFDCSLVVFSTQPLLPPAPKEPSQSRTGGMSLMPDYRESGRRSVRDAQNRLRFESTKAAVRPMPSVVEVLRQGSLERLLELLARGQLVIDRIVGRFGSFENED